jgi:hypothetical protein
MMVLHLRRTLALASCTALAAALLLGPAQAGPAALRVNTPGAGGATTPACGPAGFSAAASAVDITPAPPRGHSLREVNLGGYGIGTQAGLGGAAGLSARPTTWIRDRLYARALVVGCAGGPVSKAVAIEEIDNQGMSVAYRVGPYGLEDIRGRAAKLSGMARGHIVVATDHSHAGPDLIGAWGFVPTWYLTQVRDGAIAALTRAAAALTPVTLTVGQVAAPELVHTQYTDPSIGALDRVDSLVRVLRATTPSGRVVATLVDFAAHSTVMGSDNHGASPDWPGRLASQMETKGGAGTVVVLEGTNGKTQPIRPSPPAAIAHRPEMTSPTSPLDGDGWATQTYAALVAARVGQAVAHARAVSGHELVGDTVYLSDVAVNPALLGLMFGGGVIGGQVERSTSLPWAAGAVIGTLAASLRIGNVVIDAAPGEAYPAVQHTISDATKAAPVHFFAGLADDQLGYLIAPIGTEVAAAQAAAGGNDNLLFNVSPTIGDHVTCGLLAALAGVGLHPSPGAGAPQTCAALSVIPEAQAVP